MEPKKIYPRIYRVLFGILLTCPCFKGQETPIAFSAARTTDLSSVEFDTPITFNFIDVNVGNSFDGSTFAVPIQGLYLFTFSGKSSDMTVHLKVDGSVKRSAVVRDVDPDGAENMASNSIILLLNRFDEVRLYLSDWGNAGLINSSPETGIYTSFSGALLYESEPTFPENVIAFSAARTTNMDDVIIDMPITFDVMDTQIGTAFDGTDFITPFTGVYLFMFAGKGDYMATHLKVNGNTRRSAIVRETNGYEDNLSSNSIVVILNVDDVVNLQLSEWGDNIDNTSPSNGIFTSLSGVLLAETISYELEDQVEMLPTNPIAFSATRTANMDSVLADRVIDFNLVDTNIGQGFDGISTFTAPVKGYYLFTFAAKSLEMAVHLKVNNVMKRSAITDDAQSIENMASNSMIALLEQDDSVNLQLSPYGSSGLYGTSGSDGIFISFSGVLLYEALV